MRPLDPKLVSNNFGVATRQSDGEFIEHFVTGIISGSWRYQRSGASMLIKSTAAFRQEVLPLTWEYQR